MFQTAIISDIHDWHTKKIEFFLKKNGCNVTRLKFGDIKLNFSENKFFSIKTFINLMLYGFVF